MPNYVFLTGHRKAGTTLLMSLFDGHKSAISYPSDIGLLYAYFPCFTNAKDASAEELHTRIELVLTQTLSSIRSENNQAEIDTARVLQLFWKYFADQDLRSRAAIVDALGKTWCEYTGAPLDGTTVVFKETSQAIFFEEISNALPGLKMIHLVRDPRDNYSALKAGVANYYARLGENELETLASLINRCRMDMIAARTNMTLNPKDFAAIRFEDLVTDPEPVLRSLCRLLGWKFDNAMLSPTVLGVAQSGNSHEGKAFTKISADNAGAWRKRISADEAKVIEYWCEREMNDWNYPLEFDAAERQRAFADFYSWYNCRYFFSDSFKKS